MHSSATKKRMSWKKRLSFPHTSFSASTTFHTDIRKQTRNWRVPQMLGSPNPKNTVLFRSSLQRHLKYIYIHLKRQSKLQGLKTPVAKLCLLLAKVAPKYCGFSLRSVITMGKLWKCDSRNGALIAASPSHQ